MPLTKKGNKIMSAMKGQYGTKKGKQVFYASENKGVIKGVHNPVVSPNLVGQGKEVLNKFYKKVG